MKEYKSKCCASSVTVGGKGMTHYYVCSTCKKACDVVEDMPKHKFEICPDCHKRGVYEFKGKSYSGLMPDKMCKYCGWCYPIFNI